MARKVSEPKDAASPKPKRKRVKVVTGQLTAVPLLDGSFALVHVALHDMSIIAAHYAHRAESPALLLQGLDEAMRTSLIAVLEVTSDEIHDGHWPVIGHREPAYPTTLLDTKGVSYTASASRGLFEAFYGIRPWDEMAIPRWYDQMLLPGVPVPSTARYKRDFDQHAPSGSATATTDSTKVPDSKPCITEGPGVIHIEIKYPGEGLPPIPLLKRRQAIEEGLESAGAGTVIDAGGGGGVMDVYLETVDVAHALPFVREAVNAAGFHDEARIEVEPPSDGATDEDAS